MNSLKYTSYIRHFLESDKRYKVTSQATVHLYIQNNECFVESHDPCFPDEPKVLQNFKEDFESAVKFFDEQRELHGHGDMYYHGEDLTKYKDSIKVVLMLDSGIEIIIEDIYIRTLCGRMIVVGERDQENYIINEKEFNSNLELAVEYFEKLKTMRKL